MSRSSISSSGRNRERGMVSALFVLAAVPILMILLCVGLELTHFFGTHDDIQRIVDRETRASVTKGISAAETERSVLSQLGQFSELIELGVVKSVKTPEWADTRVEGRFRGIFSELALRLAGASAPQLPIRVSARVRKVSSRALVMLDRSVLAAAKQCDDPELIALEAFVDSLALALSQGGVGGLRVAVIPGSQGPIELLGASDAADLVERCRPRRPDLLFDVASVAGSREAHDPQAVALGAAAIADEELLLRTAESRSVVLVQSGAVARARGYAEPLITLLDAYARDRMVRVGVMHVVLDGQDLAKVEVPPPAPYGAELRSLVTTKRELAHPNLVVAMRGKMSDRSVLVF